MGKMVADSPAAAHPPADVRLMMVAPGSSPCVSGSANGEEHYIDHRPVGERGESVVEQGEAVDARPSGRAPRRCPSSAASICSAGPFGAGQRAAGAR